MNLNLSSSNFIFLNLYLYLQSFTRQFQNETQGDIDEDFINFGNDEDENEVFKDAALMDDLLGQWDNGGGTGNKYLDLSIETDIVIEILFIFYLRSRYV